MSTDHGKFMRVSPHLTNGSNPVLPVADAATNATITLDFEHHEIHEGDHYSYGNVQDLALNEVYDIQWTTPNTTTWANFTFVLKCEKETEWYIYEGVTINTPGTAITPINNNRNSSNTSVHTVAGILNTSIANANADTAVAGSTVVAHGIIGALQQGGIESREKEIILKQNTIYCMRAIANVAGYVNFLMEWYEHVAIA